MKTLKYFVVMFLLMNVFTSCTKDDLSVDEELYQIEDVLAQGGEDDDPTTEKPITNP